MHVAPILRSFFRGGTIISNKLHLNEEKRKQVFTGFDKFIVQLRFYFIVAFIYLKRIALGACYGLLKEKSNNRRENVNLVSALRTSHQKSL